MKQLMAQRTGRPATACHGRAVVTTVGTWRDRSPYFTTGRSFEPPR